MTAIPQQRLLAATVHVLVLYMSLLLVVGVTENQGGQDGRGMIENLEMSEGSAMEKTDENGWERKGKVADEEEVNFRKPNDLIHSLGLFEADIRLTVGQKNHLGTNSNMPERENVQEGQHDIHERAVLAEISTMWPGGVVPYTLSSRLSRSYISVIADAMRMITERTCVKFVPRNQEDNYIRIIKGNGCYSYVGLVGGYQEVSIGDGCQYLGTVLHELLHVLGRWHEQSRPDRDQHIVIHLDNVEKGYLEQFERVSADYATTQGIGYDYYSLMHYNAYAFSKNGRPTITPRDSRVRHSDLGQRSTFTGSDIEHVRRLYCNEPQPTAKWTEWSSWSSCSSSCGHGQQIRTRSCEGPQGISCPPGQRTESRSCSSPPCPGSWSSWGQWSSCSPSCGENRRRERKRTCEGGQGCVGATTQTQLCTSISCDSNGLGEWSQWSACSIGCKGFQFRHRRCLIRLRCRPPYFQFRNCQSPGRLSCSPLAHQQGKGAVTEEEGERAMRGGEPEGKGQKQTPMLNRIIGLEEVANSSDVPRYPSGAIRHKVLSWISVVLIGLCCLLLC